jgi:N6-L-threonylcarbamoyladenine synthase/protein kinase Bud32
VLDVDPATARIVFQRVGESDLRESLSEATVGAVGTALARIHDAGFVHGDPTTRNVRVATGGATRDERAERARRDGPRTEAVSEANRDGANREQRVYLIDFGLGYYTDEPEDHAMDLHVLAQSLAGTADDPEALFGAATDAYRTESGHADAVFASLADIEGRGRYQ